MTRRNECVRANLLIEEDSTVKLHLEILALIKRGLLQVGEMPPQIETGLGMPDSITGYLAVFRAMSMKYLEQEVPMDKATCDDLRKIRNGLARQVASNEREDSPLTDYPDGWLEAMLKGIHER
jgi:hypothetical protein